MPLLLAAVCIWRAVLHLLEPRAAHRLGLELRRLHLPCLRATGGHGCAWVEVVYSTCHAVHVTNWRKVTTPVSSASARHHSKEASCVGCCHPCVRSGAAALALQPGLGWPGARKPATLQPNLASTLSSLLATCWRHVGDMLATKPSVHPFKPVGDMLAQQAEQGALAQAVPPQEPCIPATT